MKIFRNEDCTYTALYGHYLHYQKAPGQWEEVDLNFRSDGPDYVMDRHDIEVRITGAVIRATERASGKGIRWVMPHPPVVAGRSARFAAGGLQWEYTTTKGGLKLSATVPAPLGQRTWEFPYQLVGGAAGLSVDEEGNLVSDVFSVPCPYALGADGKIYEVASWRLLPGSRVAFDFDDSALPPEAFPYELDPTTTFSVASGTDDGHVTKAGIIYPPPGEATPSTSYSTISTIRSVTDSCPAASQSFGPRARSSTSWIEASSLCPFYEIRNALMRWNTSALPDTAVITGATLRAFVSAKYNDDSRSLSADWYAAWPIEANDYSETAQLSAINNRSIVSITTGADNDFALSNPSFYVSKTGYTGLRLHVSGGQPNGRNQVDIRAYESTISPEPRLLVTYSTPPDISLVSDAPDPVTAGDPLTFSVSWTDADPGDTVRTVICRTNQIISGGSCPGGYWGYGNLSSTSPSTASFTPTALHHGTQTYYGFVCDAAGACSSSLSGTFTVQNRTPAITTASDAPDPVVAGNPVTFTASWSDPGDTARAVICKTNEVSSGTCPGGAWAIGSLSYSPSTVSFTPWDIAVGTQNYYAFACDAAGACSGSFAGTFEVTPTRLLIDDLFAVVAERVPGFGGIYVDEGTAELFVLLTNPSQAAALSAQQNLVEVLGDSWLGTLTPVALQADYEFLQLKQWHESTTGDVLSIPGAIFTDVDDDRNRINIGVEDVQVQGPAVAAVLSQAGIPSEAVIIEEAEWGDNASSLQDRHRPLVGGIQIWGVWEEETAVSCTLGFNAVRAGVAGFVTNAHCSALAGVDDHTIYWQHQPDPLSFNDIGEETVDPPMFSSITDSQCGAGRVCRYSDANFTARYSGVTRDQGRIARPAQVGSISWGGTTYRIVGEHKAVEGNKVIKVGRTTGRTSGDVTATCANRNVRDTNITLICQARASYEAQAGDSGSPVFWQTGADSDSNLDVKLVGINWTKAKGPDFKPNYFSAINNIQKAIELGEIKTCHPDFSC